MRAYVQAGGRDDDGCARGHFVQVTAHLRKPPARPAFGKFSEVCARRRTASAQHVHHMVGWAGWGNGRWHLCNLCDVLGFGSTKKILYPEKSILYPQKSFLYHQINFCITKKVCITKQAFVSPKKLVFCIPK